MKKSSKIGFQKFDKRGVFEADWFDGERSFVCVDERS